MRLLVSSGVLRVWFTVLLFGATLSAAGMVFMDANSSQPTECCVQSQRAEAQDYEEWYLVFKDRQLTRTVDLGESYLKTYPTGKYADFIKIIIGFAREALDPNRREVAENLRSQVLSTLTENGAELGSLIRSVLNNQLDVNSKIRGGATALMFAAANGDADSLRSLIEKKADIDETENTHGWTALIYSIWHGEHSNVKYLLKYYPKADIKDREGRTALDHAKATGDFDMMLLIMARPIKGQAN